MSNHLKLTVGGEPIEKFRIVYAESPEELFKGKNPRNACILDSDFDRQTAERFAKIMEKYAGAKLSVVKDAETAPENCEICVGKTNRTENGDLPFDAFRIWVKNGKLFILGGCYGATWHALDSLESLLLQAEKMDLGEDFKVCASYPIKQIGCMGDSVTVGWNEDYFDFDFLSYTKQLGHLLWKDATVENYAKGGVTMRADDRYAYVKSEEYAACIANASRFDLVTVSLGINDARYIQDKDWTADADRIFKESALKITREIRAKNPQAKVLFLSPINNYEGKGAAIRPVVKSANELQEYLAANGEKVDFYNMNAQVRNFEEYQKPDGIHLTVEGLALYAQKLAPVVKEIL